MADKSKKTVVNAWNEWDPLKHVIVGRVEGTMTPAPEPGMVRHLPDVGIPAGEWGPLPDELVEKGKVQIEAFASMLEERGIRVDRPAPFDFSQKVQTPDWENDSMFGSMPPRDVLVTVGNEILEATMTVRSRWYEYLVYRHLLEQYFKDDPNFLWEAAPKPRLTDESYEPGYWQKYEFEWDDETKEKRMLERRWWLSDKEPLFDAADIIRFGKDIFVQASGVTNAPGISWLKRHFKPRGIRVHEVAFDGYDTPWHIDTTVIAPRPGLLLQSPIQKSLTPEFHELFKINGWEIVETAEYSRTEFNPYCFCGPWLSNNCFSIDPKTICIESAEVLFMDQMDALGFDVIPVDFHEVSPFGGGLHCATVEIFREGDCEDYFPKQIEGY
jgi:glycine amidinotransferase